MKELTTLLPSESVSITNYQNGLLPGFSPSPYSGSLEVDKGQKVFFRISKNPSENNDEVLSNPIISYLENTNIDAYKDENLVSHKVSAYEDGFILSSN